MSATDVEVVEVLVHCAGRPARRTSANPAAPVGELLRSLGVDDDLLVFEAEVEVPDDGDADIESQPIAGERRLRDLTGGPAVSIHCHHCRQIRTTVNYHSRSIERKLPPSTRATKVLRWAKRKFELTDADADNLVLFLCDGGEQVRGTDHLGELTSGGKCEIRFDLSKEHNIEGNA